jgi:hypothetical protein
MDVTHWLPWFSFITSLNAFISLFCHTEPVDKFPNPVMSLNLGPFPEMQAEGEGALGRSYESVSP